jgi:acetoin utilization protein AcuB
MSSARHPSRLAVAPIATVMTPRPFVLAPSERLDIALSLMVNGGFRHLPVTESGDLDGALVGIVSVRDLLAAALPRGSVGPAAQRFYLKTIQASQVMRSPVHTAQPDTTAWEAARLLAALRVSALPIVERDRLVGIVTESDLLGLVLSQLEAEGDTMREEPTVAHLMTPSPIVTVEADAPLAVARAALHEAGVRHAPVLADGRLVGVLSDRDLLAAQESIVPHGVEAPEEPRRIVVDVMSATPLTALADERAADAGRRLLQRKIDFMPVLRGDRIVGVLSVSDYLMYLLSQPADAESPSPPPSH